jgi:hypothetical protein
MANPSPWSSARLFSLPNIEILFCSRSQAHASLTGTFPTLDCAPLEVGGVVEERGELIQV